MSTAGVSRSGRVRKKSAKLIEMENESTAPTNTPIVGAINTKNLIKSSTITPVSGNDSNNNIDSNDDNDLNIDDTVVTPDPDIGKPLKKKLKIKLSLTPSPAISSEVTKPLTINSEKSVKIDNKSAIESATKRATIPPLKIPKSKITGLLSPNTPNMDTVETQPAQKLKITEEIAAVSEPTSVERKLKLSANKKVKTSINKEINDSKPDIKIENQVIESTPKVEIAPPKVEERAVKVVSEPPVVTTNDNTIVETPKVNKILKPKKKEQESAANRLFRQITSGVPVPTPKTKLNRKKKSFPSQDLLTPSPDEDFEETSLVIATEDLIKAKPKNKRLRPMKSNDKKEEKKSKKAKILADGEKPRKKRSVITAYMLWSKEHRSKIQQTCPDMDFANVSKRLGEIWQSMPKNEKTQWKRKAQKLKVKGSSLISTGKPKLPPNLPKINSFSPCSTLSSDLLNNDDYSRYTSVDEPRPIGTTPIDVSAHLRLLGESLSIIGQRLKEHSGQIAVSGSLSVLLDSTLCAIGPLLCLTKLDPKMDGCSQETHKKTLDNIAYIMPGI